MTLNETRRLKGLVRRGGRDGMSWSIVLLRAFLLPSLMLHLKLVLQESNVWEEIRRSGSVIASPCMNNVLRIGSAVCSWNCVLTGSIYLRAVLTCMWKRFNLKSKKVSKVKSRRDILRHFQREKRFGAVLTCLLKKAFHFSTFEIRSSQKKV